MSADKIPDRAGDLFCGMRIIASPLAAEKTRQPVRVHKRRRWMSDHYHGRIQKKWTKRFGLVMKPCMFKVSPRAAGLPGADYLLVHPALMADVRAALVADDPR